jgi:glyoxylase-like metal-dependent hydrolase (beta-lactamase superfamily II)
LTGAPVVSHRLEAVRLAEGKTAEASPVTRFGALVARIIGSPPIEPVKADILVDDTLDLRPFGVAGKLIHTPGHTIGSLTVVLDNGEMIAGDLFNGKAGWRRSSKRAGRPFFAYDLDQLAVSLRKIASLKPSIIYNSHGVPVDADAVTKLAKSLERR